MPRPALNDRQIEEFRARILIEAGRIVRRDGYGGLSMRNLAAAVGLTAGALYRYFPGKHQVLIAYCAHALEDLHACLQVVAREQDDPLQVIERMLITYGAFALADRDRFRILFLDEEVSQLGTSEAYPITAYDLVKAKVAQALDAGLLLPMPVEDAARLLWGSVHGLVTLATTIREIDFSDIENLVLIAARTAIRGLSVHPDRL